MLASDLYIQISGRYRWRSDYARHSGEELHADASLKPNHAQSEAIGAKYLHQGSVWK